MKLVTCAECAQSINTKRDACPFCGTATMTSVKISNQLYAARTLEERVQAAYALGEMATPGAVRLLANGLTNRYRYSPELSHCIAQRLARIGEPAVPALEALLDDRVADPYAREALHILHPEAVADPSDQLAGGDRIGAASPDIVGETLVKMKSSAELQLGLVTGAAVIVITWLATFLLGLIPARALGVALLSPASKGGAPFDTGWWVVWSLLGHFGGTVRFALGPNTSVEDFGQGSYDLNLTALVPLAIFVGVMVLVGICVRRASHASIRARFLVLLVTAVIVAVVVVVVAMLGGRSVVSSQSPGGVADYSIAFDAFSFFLRAFIITMLSGLFAFGVVELLAPPHATALRSAMRYASATLVIVALVLPLVLGFYGDSSIPGRQIQVIGLGTLVSPAVGSAVIPMAFGAQATAGVERADLNAVASYVADRDAGGNLTRFLRSYSAGRIFWYAGYKGIVGRLAAFALVVVLLAIWVDTVRRYVKTMGAPTGLGGLETGAYLGLLTGLAVTLLAWLLTIHLGLASYDMTGSAAITLTMGLTSAALFYVLFVVTLTGALTGYLLGTFWPSPARYPLHEFVDLAYHLGARPTAQSASPGPINAAVPIGQAATLAAPLASSSLPLVATGQPAPLARALPPEAQPSAAGHVAPIAGQVAPIARPAPAQQATPVATDAAPSTLDPVERLRKLAQLRDAGVLTPEEFDTAKQKILDSL